jgi:AICAR transformylase/IMP cyclohydrolase PurH
MSSLGLYVMFATFMCLWMNSKKEYQQRNFLNTNQTISYGPNPYQQGMFYFKKN